MVVLILVDGMRPDGLKQADTPVLDRLIREGSSTMAAQTVMPSVTLPCHTSMMRGVPTERHGITSNTFHPLARPVPSVFDIAAQSGLRCGFFYNWPQLRDLCDPDSLAVSVMLADNHRPEGDVRVANEFVRFALNDKLDLVFVYLGWTDECGHDFGWMGPEYLEAIANADQCIGRIVEAVPGATFIVLADHGGHDRHHGTDMPEDMTIPWIVYGPDVDRGSTIESPVRIYDTAPTVAQLLGLRPSPIWEGRSIPLTTGCDL